MTLPIRIVKVWLDRRQYFVYDVVEGNRVLLRTTSRKDAESFRKQVRQGELFT